MENYSDKQKLLAEFTGTMFLLMAIVGSGIMGETLAAGSTGLALLCNAISVGTALIVLITVFGPISGAHFNPAVTLLMILRKEINFSRAFSYIAVQIAGALIGTILAHIMFDQPWFQVSDKIRTGAGQWVAEAVATFGLLMTIIGTARLNSDRVAFMVGLYIISAFWFTASTSFANPAVTIGRIFSHTFAGIAPTDAPGFIIAQMIAVLVAFTFSRYLFGRPQRT